MTMRANGSGQAVIDGSTTNFRGPPLVVVNERIDFEPGLWSALSDFADSMSAPLIVTNGDEAELTIIRNGLLMLRKWWQSDRLSAAAMCLDTHRRPWGFATWGEGDWNGFYLPQKFYPPYGGPILLAPSSESVDRSAAVWLWASSIARSTAHHPYGIGMMAVSTFQAYACPPIYQIQPGTYATALPQLQKIWRAPPAPTLAQYEALAQADERRRGIARLIHPSLVGWVRLDQ